MWNLLQKLCRLWLATTSISDSLDLQWVFPDKSRPPFELGNRSNHSMVHLNLSHRRKGFLDSKLRRDFNIGYLDSLSLFLSSVIVVTPFTYSYLDDKSKQHIRFLGLWSMSFRHDVIVVVMLSYPVGLIDHHAVVILHQDGLEISVR